MQVPDRQAPGLAHLKRSPTPLSITRRVPLRSTSMLAAYLYRDQDLAARIELIEDEVLQEEGVILVDGLDGEGADRG